MTVPFARLTPDFAEFTIGPAKGGTRWPNPGYGCHILELTFCFGRARHKRLRVRFVFALVIHGGEYT
jgi:hypothetical protein